jgi:EAL and modified HD-GYP domain-containing signal transduction protein
MKFYTARQPILNKKKHVVAYELLFRDSEKNCFPSEVSAEIATAKLLVNSYINCELEDITDGKPALVNFPTALLTDHLQQMVPYQNIIIEILETVAPTDEMYEVLKTLFHRGYTLALDDFVYDPAWDRFLPFIKLIKIDIIETPLLTIAHLMPHFRKFNIKMLAEKVETYDEFAEAQALGFEYYQGYFFYKPEVIVKESESSHPFLMSIYSEVMKDDFSYKSLSKLFEQDLDLTYKLLRFVNSSFFEHTNDITSIKQAIAFLGEHHLRKFVCLIVMANINPDKPSILIKSTILRAKICEVIAQLMGEKNLIEAAFLTGLFSTIDAILDKPLDKILTSLPLAQNINDALLKQQGSLSVCLEVAIAYMNGDWDIVNKFTKKNDIDTKVLISKCSDAYVWLSKYNLIQKS